MPGQMNRGSIHTGSGSRWYNQSHPPPLPAATNQLQANITSASSRSASARRTSGGGGTAGPPTSHTHRRSGSGITSPSLTPIVSPSSVSKMDPRGDTLSPPITIHNHPRTRSVSPSSSSGGQTTVNMRPVSRDSSSGDRKSVRNSTSSFDGRHSGMASDEQPRSLSEQGGPTPVSSRPSTRTTEIPQVTEIADSSPYPTAQYQGVEHPVDQSIFGSCLLTLFFLVVSLIFFGPFLAIVIPLVMIALGVRWTMLCCCCCRYTQLSYTELRWLQAPVPILALLVLERSFDINRIRDLVYTRVITSESKPGHRLYPRFSQKVVSLNSGYAWKTDEVFRIEDHITRVASPVSDIGEVLSALAAVPQDWNRPLWDIHVVPEYPSSSSNKSGGQESLVIIRLHPAIGDGISLVHLLCSALSDDQVTLVLKPRFAASARFFNAMRFLVIGPVVFVHKWLLTRRDFNIFHPPASLMVNTTGMPLCRNPSAAGRNSIGGSASCSSTNGVGGHPSVSKRAFHFRSYSLAKVTRLKQVTRSTYNDLFLSVLAGALRSYQQARGVDNPFDLLTLVAVDMTQDSNGMNESRSMNSTGAPTGPTSGASTGGRSNEIKFKNNYVLVDLCLPTNTEGMIPRLWQIRQRMEELKNSADPLILDSLSRIIYTLFPVSWASRILASFSNNSSVTAVSLQGPDSYLSLASREIKAIAFWYPPVGQVNVSVTFFSYVDRLFFSVSGDETLVPKLEIITSAIAKQFDHMMVLLENRRIPGEHKSSRGDPGGSRGGQKGTTRRGSGGGVAMERSVSAEVVRGQMNDLQQRLNLVQSKLQEADLLPTNELDSLRSTFSELMSELRRLKSTGLDGSQSDMADFDEEIDYDSQAKSRRGSLSSLAGLNARRRSLGSALARPLNVVGPRSRSGSRAAIHSVAPRKQSQCSTYPSDLNVNRLSPEDAESYFLAQDGTHSPPGPSVPLPHEHRITLELSPTRPSNRWWNDDV